MLKKVVFLWVFIAMGFAVEAQNTQKNGGQSMADARRPEELPCYSKKDYVWSVVRNECILVYQTGINLLPKTNYNKDFSAFIVFKKNINDDATVELFRTSESKTSTILTKTTTGQWKNKEYILKKNQNVYSLFNIKNELLYQGRMYTK